MKIPINPATKALIFDLDGTLSNSLPVHTETWRMIGKKYGFEFDPQIIYELTGRPTIEFAQRIIERYQIDEKPEVLVQQKQESFWKLAHLLQPVPEVVEIVKTYHGKLPMSVGTGASGKSARVQLEALGLRDYFEAVISADDVTQHKPHPETFLKCAELMHVAPEFCQVFEDGDLGISAAREGQMMVTDVRDYICYGEWAQ